jgi:hypothetical protein
MNEVQNLLGSISEKGAQIWIENGELRYKAPKNALSPTDLERLRAKKAEIILHLKSLLVVPLSIQQQSLWNRTDPLLSRNLVTGIAFRLAGRLDLSLLRETLEIMCRRHEALLTRINVIDGAPQQHVEEIPDDLLQELPSREDDTPESARKAVAEASRFCNTPFNLESGLLFKCGLLKLGKPGHLLVLAMDHLNGDGLSIKILVRELLRCYADLELNRPSSLPQAPMQYGDYALWQRRNEARWEKVHGTYWQRRLDGARRVQLPIDRDITGIPSNKIAQLRIDLGEPGSTALRQLARQLQTTLGRVVLGLYVAWLAVLTRSRDFIVPFSALGRRPEDFGTVGFFAQILYLRMEIDESDTFVDIVRKSSHELTTACQHLDFGKIAFLQPEFHHGTRFHWEYAASEDLSAPHESGVVRVSSQPAPDLRSASSGLLRFFPLKLPTGIAEDARGPFDTVLRFWDSSSGIVGTGGYRADLFKTSTIERFTSVMLSLVEQIRQDPNCLLVGGGRVRPRAT